MLCGGKRARGGLRLSSDILDGADRGVCGLNSLFSYRSQFLIHGPSYAFSYAGLPGMRYC